MEIEKEIRYKVDKSIIENIILLTDKYKERKEMLDITCGYDGFESLTKYGFICRVRQKDKLCSLEVKKYLNVTDSLEQSIKIDSVVDGINYLRLIGMEPYLYLKRYREVRKYKGLKIFIDEFDILGDYVEIEYQDSINSKFEMEEFIKLARIVNFEPDKYGDIVKKKLATDIEFKKIFNEKLNNTINTIDSNIYIK